LASPAVHWYPRKTWYIRWYLLRTSKSDANMPLTDIEIRKAKPNERLVKLSGEGYLRREEAAAAVLKLADEGVAIKRIAR
jgi:hypothetical protein